MSTQHMTIMSAVTRTSTANIKQNVKTTNKQQAHKEQAANEQIKYKNTEIQIAKMSVKIKQSMTQTPPPQKHTQRMYDQENY